jgi:hypothetical protein
MRDRQSGQPRRSIFFLVPQGADVLRVSSGRIVYYSGRSSWLDVSSLRIAGRERLEIVTKAGKTYKVKPPYEVSDQGITLQSSEESTKISKSEIAQVYDVVVKPLTANGDYLAEELGPMIIFDPDLYVYALHLEHYVPVLPYNSSDPEDDFPIQCVWR